MRERPRRPRDGRRHDPALDDLHGGALLRPGQAGSIGRWTASPLSDDRDAGLDDLDRCPAVLAVECRIGGVEACLHPDGELLRLLGERLQPDRAVDVRVEGERRHLVDVLPAIALAEPDLAVRIGLDDPVRADERPLALRAEAGLRDLEADQHLGDDAVAHDDLGQAAPARVRVAGEIADRREDDLDLGVGEPAQRIEQVDAHVQPRAALAGLVRPAVVVGEVGDHRAQDPDDPQLADAAVVDQPLGRDRRRADDA